MPGRTGARLRARTTFRTVAVDTRRPCIAAETVAALGPAAAARSHPSRPRRASSNLNRSVWIRVLATLDHSHSAPLSPSGQPTLAAACLPFGMASWRGYPSSPWSRLTRLVRSSTLCELPQTWWGAQVTLTPIRGARIFQLPTAMAPGRLPRSLPHLAARSPQFR
jgi:hypothetical protein